MKTKILDVNRKVLLEVLSVVLAISVITPLVIAYKPYTVGIQVKTAEGKPVVGATVEIWNLAYTDVVASGLTENGGWLRLDSLVVGLTANTPYIVEASSGGITSLTYFRTDETASAMVKLSLNTPTVVSVTVVDSLGLPVPGAVVMVKGDVTITGTTDEYGIAIFGTLTANAGYLAQAQKDGSSGTTTFTTNQFGGANVLVTLL